ncbi:MAG: T9SS type A sorting domain-containing protein [Cyclobacteriaceae bacterium]
MKHVFVTILILCQVFWVYGQTWNGDGDGTNWCDADNWDDDNVPGNTDVVSIPAAFTNVEIPSGCNAEANQLDLEGGLTVKTGGTLVVSGGNLDIGKTNEDSFFTVESATVTVSGKIDAKGCDCLTAPAVGNGPTITNDGTITAGGTIKIGSNSGAGILINNGTFGTTEGGNDAYHVDGTICNTGYVYASGANAEIKLHGAVVKGGGTMSSARFEVSQGGGDGGAAQPDGATLSNQSFIGSGPGSCDSDADSANPQFETALGDTSYEDLLLDPGYDPDDHTEFNIETSSVKVCSESGASVLPVELLYFKGNSNDSKIELTWATATEIDNDYFEIEKSPDGTKFAKIGEVPGNGDSNEVINYSYTDENVRGVQNFYRLKQVDYDGKFEYFNIIMVLNAGASGVSIYPNPVQNKLIKIQVENLLQDDLVRIELADLSGKILQKTAGYKGTFELSTEALLQGTYLVRVSRGKSTQVRKVFVN